MRALCRRLCPADDDGVSVLELMIAMSLMTVFGALFTSAMLLMNSSSIKAQSLTVVSSQLDQAFENLDRTVRYASAITVPGQGAGTGDWYVEMNASYTGTQVCTQLRVDTSSQQLQSRSWTPSNGAAAGLTAWRPLASGITYTAAPFALGATVGVTFQQLTVQLQSSSGVAGQTTTSASTVTFTAVNSSTTANNALCGEAGRP